MSQKINSTDLILTTPQWSAFCASEKGNRKKMVPDFIVDKRTVVQDPVSKKKFYVCKMTNDASIYKEVKGLL